MPEATVYEYGDTMAREGQIRTRSSLGERNRKVDTKPPTSTMKLGPKAELGSGVSSAIAPHAPGDRRTAGGRDVQRCRHVALKRTGPIATGDRSAGAGSGSRLARPFSHPRMGMRPRLRPAPHPAGPRPSGHSRGAGDRRRALPHRAETTRRSRSSTSFSAARSTSRRPGACTAVAVCGCLPLCPSVEVGGDAVRPYVLLMNSRDGSTAVIAATTPVRVVCQNTLNWGLRSARQKFSIRHAEAVTQRAHEARRVLDLSINYYEQFKRYGDQLASERCTERQLRAVLDELYSNGTGDSVSGRTRKSRQQDEGPHRRSVPARRDAGQRARLEVGYRERRGGVRRLAAPDALERSAFRPRT
jgi:Domain of unknown function (DUF932)